MANTILTADEEAQNDEVKKTGERFFEIDKLLKTESQFFVAFQEDRTRATTAKELGVSKRFEGDEKKLFVRLNSIRKALADTAKKEKEKELAEYLSWDEVSGERGRKKIASNLSALTALMKKNGNKPK